MSGKKIYSLYGDFLEIDFENFCYYMREDCKR